MPLLHSAMGAHLPWALHGLSLLEQDVWQLVPLLHSAMGAHLAWALHQLSLLQQ